VVTTLAGLAEAAASLSGPALLIVGEAMALAQAGEGREVLETILLERPLSGALRAGGLA
jgi:uroporphyrin-III C-methyltransferase